MSRPYVVDLMKLLGDCDYYYHHKNDKKLLADIEQLQTVSEIIEADIAIEQEVLVGNIYSLQVVMSEHSDKTRRTPIYDTLSTTEAQYADFWNTVLQEEKRW